MGFVLSVSLFMVSKHFDVTRGIIIWRFCSFIGGFPDKLKRIMVYMKKHGNIDPGVMRFLCNRILALLMAAYHHFFFIMAHIRLISHPSWTATRTSKIFSGALNLVKRYFRKFHHPFILGIKIRNRGKIIEL